MGGLKPKMFGEKARFNALTPLPTNNLEMGDLLVVKELDSPLKSDSDANFIRFGQAVFSHVQGGTALSEHVLMITDNGVESTVEAVGDGVICRTYVTKRPHEVYRCKDPILAAEAVGVGLALSGGARVGAALMDYGHYKIHASPFRLKRKILTANGRIRQLYDIAYNGASRDGVKMICSEFVASCYEVAALRLQTDGLGYDPRGLTAKALEAVLNRSTLFQPAGRYTGKGLTIQVSGPIAPQTPGQHVRLHTWEAGAVGGGAARMTMGTHRDG